MVHVNEILANGTVRPFKIETTDLTIYAELGYARCSCSRTPFYRVYDNFLDPALRV